ncbi:hypothetical protein [Thermosynechococcus sp.]|nr:hypothetical protein [Thermosynechococcus sp.]
MDGNKDETTIVMAAASGVVLASLATAMRTLGGAIAPQGKKAIQ